MAKEVKKALEIVPHHAGVSVPDIEQSIKWYQDMLDFSLENRMEIPPLKAKIAIMKSGNFRIELFEVAGAKSLPADRRNPEKDIATHGWKHLAMGVRDVLKTMEILKKRGVDVAMESVMEGKPMAFIRDNAGNLVEINQI